MSTSNRTIEFYYDFASTYSYLSAMRIEAMATKAGVVVEWKPFLLGPVFQAQGWNTSPFNLYPAKGRYMIRDLERLAQQRGLIFHTPTPFPQNGLTAARIALACSESASIANVSRAIFSAEFAEQKPIADPYVHQAILQSLDIDYAHILARSSSPEIKQSLRDQTAAAMRYGIFGAPTFRTSDGELFWGDDRLEQALSWAAIL